MCVSKLIKEPLCPTDPKSTVEHLWLSFYFYMLLLSIIS